MGRGWEIIHSKPFGHKKVKFEQIYCRTGKFQHMKISRIWAIGNSRAGNFRKFSLRFGLLLALGPRPRLQPWVCSTPNPNRGLHSLSLIKLRCSTYLHLLDFTLRNRLDSVNKPDIFPGNPL